jgi:hypothetical protein
MKSNITNNKPGTWGDIGAIGATGYGTGVASYGVGNTHAGGGYNGD